MSSRDRVSSRAHGRLAEALAEPPYGPRVKWFSFDSRSRLAAGCRPVLGQAYLIEFIGRNAAPLPAGEHGIGGGFGHMGIWSGEVLLDDVTKVRGLGPLPGLQVRPAGAMPTCSASR